MRGARLRKSFAALSYGIGVLFLGPRLIFTATILLDIISGDLQIHTPELFDIPTSARTKLLLIGVN